MLKYYVKAQFSTPEFLHGEVLYTTKDFKKAKAFADKKGKNFTVDVTTLAIKKGDRKC